MRRWHRLDPPDLALQGGEVVAGAEGVGAVGTEDAGMIGEECLVGGAADGCCRVPSVRPMTVGCRPDLLREHDPSVRGNRTRREMRSTRIRGREVVMQPGNATILVGNGLSMAFNPELGLQKVTAEVLRRMRGAEAGGDVAVEAIRQIADQALPEGVKSTDDFEKLIGVFDAEARTLEILSTLAQVTEPINEELQTSIESVSEFVNQVRDTGISYVLEVIAERSHAFMDKSGPLIELVTSILDKFDQRVVFGNLNYDTLLLAALMSKYQNHLADMGHGGKTRFLKDDNGTVHEVQMLRRNMSEFPPDRRIRLLSLHGSLTFWREMSSVKCVKVPRELIEDGSQWKAVRERTTDLRPIVVLTNRREKTEHVTRYPFSVAYSAFEDGLRRSSFWVIVGYSFRDDPVNRSLRENFMTRISKPKVLVVTYGDDPSRETVELALGWGAEDKSSDSWLHFIREGAEQMQNSYEWKTFGSELPRSALSRML
jgi:hypothetical protein